MATHGTSMMLQQAAADYRRCMARIDDHIVANKADKVGEEMVTMLRQSVGIIEMMIMQHDNMPRGTHSSHKPLSECKSVNNLKILGSNKSDFKNWNEKFINAIAQGAGTPWRKFMKHLNKQLDQDRKVLTTQELDNIEGAGDIGNKTDANEDLY